MDIDPQKVEAAVETLCQRGCIAVRGIIDDMEDCRLVPGTEDLSETERQAVLAELKAIMDVYDGTCPANGVPFPPPSDND